MKRTKLAAIAVALAVTSTAAFTQDGPDFSPMKPRDFDQTQSSERAEAPLATTPADNRMLEGYESSNALPGDPASPPVADEAASLHAEPAMSPPRRGRVEQPTPRQSTIGNGLFDRRGPNDFGA